MALKRYTTVEELLTPTTTRSGGFDKSIKTSLNLSLPDGVEERKVRIRCIGAATPVFDHDAKVWNPNIERVDTRTGKVRKGDWEDKPFPDAATNTNFTRVCTQDDPAYGKCPWCASRYRQNKKFAINVIERAEDGNKVVWVCKSQGFFEQIFKLSQAQYDYEKNRDKDEEDPAKWLDYGGEVAPDFIITIKKVGNRKQDVRYDITERPNSAKKITAAEIELLKSVREITDEELEEIYDVNPEFKKLPKWYLYGHNLDRIFSPSILKPEAAATAEEDLDIPDPFSQLDKVSSGKAKNDEKNKAVVAAPISPISFEDDDTDFDTVGKQVESEDLF